MRASKRWQRPAGVVGAPVADGLAVGSTEGMSRRAVTVASMASEELVVLVPTQLVRNLD